MTNGPRKSCAGSSARENATCICAIPLPVHLTYFTLSVDESGALKSFDDLYGFDRKVRAALGLGS